MANLLFITIVFGLTLNINAQQKNIVKNVGHQRVVKSMAFSPDGKYLLVGYDTNNIQVWDLQSGKQIATLKQKGGVNSLSLSPDGFYLASGNNDSTIKIWNVQDWKEVHSFPKEKSPVKTIAFSSDGKILASGAYQTIKLWNLKTFKEIKRFSGHSSYISSLSFSADGKYLASGSEDFKVKLWDLKTKEEIRCLDSHTDWVNSISFSPDGKFLASGSSDKTVRLWDIQSRKKNVPLHRHNGAVKSVVFSPNGLYLASGGADKKIKMWDLAGARTIRTLTQNTIVNCLVFSSDGQHIASGNEDGSVVIWETSTGKQLLTILGGFPTLSDWIVYAPNGNYDGINCNKYIQDLSGVVLNDFPTKEGNYFSGILAEVFGFKQIIPDLIPPTIQLDTDSILEVSQNEFIIGGTATDQSGILLVLVNGIKSNNENGRFRCKLSLKVGLNLFQIYAYDKAGNMSSQSLTITFKPSLRKDYALLFYESDYTNSNLPNLRGTKRNADSLADILQNKYGFNTSVFANYSASEIQNTLNEYRKKSYTTNDQLLIYFAGHGQKGNADTTGYLVCADNTRITHRDFNKWAAIDSCKHILMVLDACYSGLALSIHMIGDSPPEYNPRTKDEYLKELFKIKPSRKALTSGEGKVSIPFDGLSEFTGSLINALKNNHGKLFNIFTYNELKSKLGNEYLKLESGNFYNQDEADGTFIFIKK